MCIIILYICVCVCVPYIDVTLNNFGNRPVTVIAEMIKCCEQIDETDFNCDVRI